MPLAEVLAMLGVQSEAEANAAIGRFNMMVEGVMEATGARTASEAVQRFKTLGATMRAVEKAVGAEGGDAVAKVEAALAQASRATELEAQMASSAKAAEKKSADEQIGAAISEGRLPPAMRAKAESLYNEHGIGVLQTYLAAFEQPLFKPAPQNSAKPPRQPAPQNGNGGTQSQDDELTDEEKEIARLMHRTPEQMRAGRKMWDEAAAGRDTAMLSPAHIDQLNRKNKPAVRS